MEKDVVCGIVDPAKAAGSSQYGGKTYYFCSKGYKAKFDANPRQFVEQVVVVVALAVGLTIRSAASADGKTGV